MHQTVLLQEAIEALNIRPDGFYIDATFGRGGHSMAILEKLNQNGKLLAIDKDLDAIAYGQANFKHDKRFVIRHGSFGELENIAKLENFYQKTNGIVFDLGVSSPQLDEASRGFSFIKDGPLDMRMDLSENKNAAFFINNAKKEDLIQVFFEYGEERYAKRIAEAIIKARQKEPISSTIALADIVKGAHPRWERHKHPATRVFQAIRIFVNDELQALENGLMQSLKVLTNGGRLVVISFHSLEDRIVKHFMREQARCKSYFQKIGKIYKPSASEIKQNIRARSAVMRVGEKLNECCS